MKNELISIIMPAYNVESYIEKSIYSILNQTYENFELIIINDGSTDSTLEICMRMSEKDSRIRIINQDNCGLSLTCKIGLEKARGNLVYFIDSDDYVDKNILCYLYENLINHNADIAVCGYSEVYFNKEVLYPASHRIQILNNSEAMELLMMKKIRSYRWNKLYKKHLWNDVKFIKGKNFEDVFSMHYVFFKARRIVLLPNCYYYYLQRDNSIIHVQSWENKQQKNVDAFDAFYDRFLFCKKHYPEYESYVRSDLIYQYINDIKFLRENKSLNNIENIFLRCLKFLKNEFFNNILSKKLSVKIKIRFIYYSILFTVAKY